MLMLLVLSVPVWAQNAGKISGVVTDKDTGEPLPGVNVLIQDTYLGASTDIDGFFVVLNVPPGNYVVGFNYIGYQAVNIENVRVVADITKRLDVKLSATTLELDSAIVIVAEKPFFETSATNTVRVLDSEEIERIPVKGINSIVAINSGVVVADGSGGETDNATINVRGGRGNETKFIIDGVPYNDQLFGNVTGTLPASAVEQISSQIGGFSAKYGSAQSGVINITTKSGSSKYSGGFEGISSKATDDYGYQDGTAFLEGPLWPGQNKFTFFGTLQYIDSEDDNPRAVPTDIPASTFISTRADGSQFTRDFPAVFNPQLPDNEATVTRFTGKVDATFGKLKLTLSGNGSFRDARTFINSYRKNNSLHNPIEIDDVLSSAFKINYALDNSTILDATIRVQNISHEDGDGVWFDNLDAYGDTLANQQAFPHLDFFRTHTDPISGNTVRPSQGARQVQDEIGVFFDEGRVSNRYRKYNLSTLGANINITKQLKRHLIEIGGTFDRSEVKFYSIAPTLLSFGLRDNPLTPANEQQSRNQRYFTARPAFYGYDIFGNDISDDAFATFTNNSGVTDSIFQAAPPRPTQASLYVQDKIEFQDFILTAGLRWDYFDPDFFRYIDEFDIFGRGNPNRLGLEDLEAMPSENYFSPRLGFAFPVSATTVFHAQYGIFRQAPRLLDVYSSWTSIEGLESDDNFQVDNGFLQSEETTQYEFGFKQQFGNSASLDITAYYKNVKGLTNVVRKEFKLGQDTKVYLTTDNTDFGTIRGLAFSFNLRRIGPLSTKVDYSLEVAEGTGSSQSSSFTAAFRNTNGETPKTIAPLDFDQRHTLSANADIRSGKNGGIAFGDFHPFAEAGINLLFSFNSGRPYTPLATESVLPGSASNQGEVTQFINSARRAGIMRLDLRIDKVIRVAGLRLLPYLNVQNLLDRDNYNTVYSSTGLPDDTAWLLTDEGRQISNGRGINRDAFISDYLSLERNPNNYGIPRLVRLGLKVQF